MPQNLMTDATAVLAKIKAAFPAQRAVRFEPMANTVQDSEPHLTAEAFANKDDWTRLDGRWLDQAPNGYASALNFLSDAAVCFYIPAYMTADLRNELEHAEPLYQLISGFDTATRQQPIRVGSAETWTDYGKRRWSLLTTEQACAIVHYLEWHVKKDDEFLASLASEALAFFWYDRARQPRRDL